jgi:MFS-type transporter involved in bile tolerance (Atg22 family)
MNNVKPVTGRPGKRIKDLLILVFIGQVGCVTFAILVAAVLAGLWLDNHFQSKPVFVTSLLIGSIPVSVLLMLMIVRNTVKHLRTTTGGKIKEEDQTFGANDKP